MSLLIRIGVANGYRPRTWIFAFVSEKWKELMFRTRDGQREMHRRHLEICVFTQVALDLKSTDLAVGGSEQYADYREHLLPWEECLPLLEGYCDKVGLPKTAKEFVQRLRSELETAAKEADDNYPKNTSLVINERGEPVLKKTPAREIPASATELEAALQERMPERSLIDTLWLSDRVLHYTALTQHSCNQGQWQGNANWRVGGLNQRD